MLCGLCNPELRISPRPMPGFFFLWKEARGVRDLDRTLTTGYGDSSRRGSGSGRCILSTTGSAWNIRVMF